MSVYRIPSAIITTWLATALALRNGAGAAFGGETPVPPPAFGLVSPQPPVGQPAAYPGLVDSLISAGSQSVTLPGTPATWGNPNNWLLQVPPQISGLRIPITLSLEFAANFSPPAEAIAAGFTAYSTPILPCPNNSF